MIPDYGKGQCRHKGPFKGRSESLIDAVMEPEAGGLKDGGREKTPAGSVS